MTGPRPFAAMRYLEWLRDATAGAEHGAACVAHLLALGVLDARFDTLLLPVWVRERLPDSDDPLLEYLNAQNAALGWGLPEEFFRERLASGACLILAEEGCRQGIALPYVCVDDPDGLLQSSFTCP